MKNEELEKLARAAAYQDGQIAEKDARIAELQSEITVLRVALDNATKKDDAVYKTATTMPDQIKEADQKMIDELKERLWVYDNALKMALDEKCSGDQEHCGCVPVLKGRITELQSRLYLIIDLGFDYDGFESADDLKTLIDDMVKVARGTFEIDMNMDRKSVEDLRKLIRGTTNDSCHRDHPIDHAKVADEIVEYLQSEIPNWDKYEITKILAKHYGKKGSDDVVDME